MRHSSCLFVPAALSLLSSCCWFCPSQEATPSRAVAMVSLITEFDQPSQETLARMADSDRQAALLAVWRHAGATLRPEAYAVLGRYELATDAGGWVDARAFGDLKLQAWRGLFGHEDPPPAPICIYDDNRSLSIKCFRLVRQAFELDTRGVHLGGHFGIEVHVDQKPQGLVFPVR